MFIAQPLSFHRGKGCLETKVVHLEITTTNGAANDKSTCELTSLALAVPAAHFSPGFHPAFEVHGLQRELHSLPRGQHTSEVLAA